MIRNKKISAKLMLLAFGILYLYSFFLGNNVIAESSNFTINDIAIIDKSDGVIGNISSINKNKINSDVSFYKLNDNITYKLVIQNNLKKKITIKSINDNNTNKYLEYQYEGHDNETIKANDSFELIVKVVYNNKINDVLEREQINNTKFTITYIDGGKIGNEIINPKTGFNNYYGIILGIVSAIGVLISVYCIKKDNPKEKSKISLFIMSGLLLMPINLQAAASTYSFDFVTNFEFHDVATRTTFEVGESFNSLIKELNSNMTEFKKSDVEPNLENIEYKIISTPSSIFPIYAWNENNTIYWWTKAENAYLNSNSNYMFYSFSELTNVDFSYLNASEVTTMDFMFQYCTSLTQMDLRLDTRNVVSMDAMFANDTNLVSIDFSHLNTSKVENFHGLVAGCTKLTTINLDNFNTESAKNFESMFSTLPNLTEIDISSFKTPNLENIYFMFLRCGSLTTIYASEDITNENVTNSKGFVSSATNIVGGAGTVYNAANIGKKEYFRIDDPDNGKPGYLTLKNARYIRYEGNGADGGEAMTSHYLKSSTPGNLKTNTYNKSGYTFVGWNTESDGSGKSYSDGELMNELVPSKTPLTLYAQWQ